MCTAIWYESGDRYFGRTLDYELSYGEQVVITPRRVRLPFRMLPPMERHYAMIGTGAVEEGYPLYFDAANEMGLAAAGLLFSGYAAYPDPADGRENVSPFELIPWLLGQCADLAAVRRLLEQTQIAALPFSKELLLSPLHWLIADRSGALTLEVTNEGMRVYENQVGVLTNSPSFPHHLLRLADHCGVSASSATNRLSARLSLPAYSRGMGGLGLPGDASSCSRFVRAAFLKENVRDGAGEAERVGQFFHILGGVEQVKGTVRLPEGDAHTLYTACYNLDRNRYYYSTYYNRQLTAVDLGHESLEGDGLICYPMGTEQQIACMN